MSLTMPASERTPLPCCSSTLDYNPEHLSCYLYHLSIQTVSSTCHSSPCANVQDRFPQLFCSGSWLPATSAFPCYFLGSCRSPPSAYHACGLQIWIKRHARHSIVGGSLRLSFPTGAHYTSKKLYVQALQIKGSFHHANGCPRHSPSSLCGEDFLAGAFEVLSTALERRVGNW